MTSRRAPAVLAVMTALASACGGDSASIAPRANPDARPGGTMTIAIGEPATLDPAHVFERWGRAVVSLMCDSLVELDPVTAEPKPAIAESWVVDAGGRQITLKIRKGVRFHDGTTVTADDVAFALTRAASEEEASNVAEVLRPVVGWAPLHGDEEPRNEEETTSLRGARAIGTNAVQISLTEPRADFIRALAHPLATPQPRALVSRDPSAYERRPVCTGPYALERPWQPGDRTISLVRFAGYYGENHAFTRGGRGYPDRIELRVVGDDERARADAALAGATAEGGPGRRVETVPLPYLEYLALPTARAPFDRREVRLALSLAIDRAAIARGVYGGARTPARGFLPVATGEVARADGCGASAPERADVAAARRALRASGVDLRDRVISLFYNPDFENRALVTAIARQWNAAFGTRARAVAVPWSRYLPRTTARDGFDGPFRMGWEPRYLGPDPMLAPLFASASIGRDNVTGFNDPRFDRALARDARRAGSIEDRRRHYRRLEDIVCEQMPAIPVVFGGALASVDPQRVGSAVSSFVDRADGSLALRELFVRARP